MKPALVASATVGYCIAVARAWTSSTASAWRCAGVSGLSGPSSATSSALVRRAIAVGCVVGVVGGLTGDAGGRVDTFGAAERPEDDEQAAKRRTAAQATA